MIVNGLPNPPHEDRNIIGELLGLTPVVVQDGDSIPLGRPRTEMGDDVEDGPHSDESEIQNRKMPAPPPDHL